MVRLSEIQQFPDFLEPFPGNSHHFPRFEILGIFGWIESVPDVRVFDFRLLSPNCTTCDMSSDILDKQIVVGLSLQWSGLDIDDIPTSQIEKRYLFWCKNGGKMVHYAYDWSRSISRLRP